MFGEPTPDDPDAQARPLRTVRTRSGEACRGDSAGGQPGADESAGQEPPAAGQPACDRSLGLSKPAGGFHHVASRSHRRTADRKSAGSRASCGQALAAARSGFSGRGRGRPRPRAAGGSGHDPRFGPRCGPPRQPAPDRPGGRIDPPGGRIRARRLAGVLRVGQVAEDATAHAGPSAVPVTKAASLLIATCKEHQQPASLAGASAERRATPQCYHRGTNSVAICTLVGLRFGM